MSIKKSFVLFALILCTPAFSQPASHLIIFGDSLSDAGMNAPHQTAGNNFWGHSEGKQGAPIVNPDPITGASPLWVNWLAKNQFKDSPLIPWRLQASGGITLDHPSTDYAFAAAETGDHYLNDLQAKPFPPYMDDSICALPRQLNDTTACVPGVLKQIELYLNDVGHPDPDTLFILWAGGNDIFNNVKKAMYLFDRQQIHDVSAWLIAQFASDPVIRAKASPRPRLPEFSDPIVNLLAAKNRLIEAGASPEQIYVINLPDLSKTPAGIRLANHSPVITETIHLLSVGFNESLSLMLAHNITSNTNLPASHILSIYDFLNEVIENPGSYNITNLSGDCFLDGQAPFCTGYLFFDDKHPTAHTGKIIAEWVGKQLQRS